MKPTLIAILLELLDEVDGHFSAHYDAEREPRTFATLLLQFPTEGRFDGGALHVRHGGIMKTVKFSLDRASQVTYAIFYANCDHELQRIRNGVMHEPLAFNLVRGGNVSFDMQARESQEFSSTLWMVEEARSLGENR